MQFSHINPADVEGLDRIVAQLSQKRTQLNNDLCNVDSALSALTGIDGQVRGIAPKPHHLMSELLSLAQEAQWAKIKAGEK